MKKILKKILKKLHISPKAAFLGAGIFVFMLSLFVIWISSQSIPDFNSFDERKIVNSTKIYDRTGKILLYDINANVCRKAEFFRYGRKFHQDLRPHRKHSALRHTLATSP